MTEQILTPTPEQVRQWLGEFFGCVVTGQLSDSEMFLATQAACWGADHELEACCKWLDNEIGAVDSCDLRAERRPKPPSLKQQALEILDDVDAQLGAVHYNILLRALETIPDD